MGVWSVASPTQPLRPTRPIAPKNMSTKKRAHNSDAAVATKATKQKQRKRDTKLVEYDESQLGYIYEGIFPETPWCTDRGIVGKSFYVGQAVNLLRRGRQHDKGENDLIEGIMKHCDFPISDAMHPVHEAPNGVPSLRLNEFEGFFMLHRKTIYHPIDNPYGCNRNNAPNIAEITPQRYKALEAEVALGVQLVLPPEWRRKVDEAKARVAMLNDVHEMVEPMKDEFPEQAKAAANALELANEDLRVALREAETQGGGIQFVYDTPYMVALKMKEKYQELELAKIPRDQVLIDMDTVADEELTWHDPETRAYINQLKKAVHPDHLAKFSTEMKATAVAGLFEMIIDVVGQKEEELIAASDDAKIKKWYARFCAWRTWSVAHNGDPPKQQSTADGTTKDDNLLGTQLADWSRAKAANSSHGGKPYVNICLVVLRDLPKYLDFIRGKALKGIAENARLSELLAQGYGVKQMKDAGLDIMTLPKFCSWCHRIDPLSAKLQNYLKGQNHDDTDAILHDLRATGQTDRANTIYQIHLDNLPKKKEKMAKFNKAHAEKLHDLDLRAPKTAAPSTSESA